MQYAHNPQGGPTAAANDISLWFPALRPRSNASLRLICFPYAGAAAAVFRAWTNDLTEVIELRVAQLPGRGVRLREDRFEQMSPLIRTLVDVLAPLLDRPVALFGHSLGAIVAFEVARSLRRMDFTPAHLFVSGNIAPHLPCPTAPIHDLPDEVFLRELQTLNGMPRAVLESKELLDIVLPAVRSDFALLENYKYDPHPPLACPITVFGGLQDPRTTLNGLDSWRMHTVGAFDLVMLPGDHFFLDAARSLLLGNIAQRLIGRSHQPVASNHGS